MGKGTVDDLTVEQKKNINDAFAMYDKDGNGNIEVSELAAVLKECHHGQQQQVPKVDLEGVQSQYGKSLIDASKNVSLVSPIPGNTPPSGGDKGSEDLRVIENFLR